MIYLIQGFWSQVRTGLDVAFDHTGAVPVLRTALCTYMFAGGFGSDPDHPDVLSGSMMDDAGRSSLTNIDLSGNELCFIKKYVLPRTDIIFYTFSKQNDGRWKGRYAGKNVGEGPAQCIVTAIPDDFITPA